MVQINTCMNSCKTFIYCWSFIWGWQSNSDRLHGAVQKRADCGEIAFSVIIDHRLDIIHCVTLSITIPLLT